jgi:transposase
LKRRLPASDIAFAKVNPRQARRFAEASGRLAKTDRVDAATMRQKSPVPQVAKFVSKALMQDRQAAAAGG